MSNEAKPQYKSTEVLAKASVNNALIAMGAITSDIKTEWQIGVEQRLDALSAANDMLSAQVHQLTAEVNSPRR